MQNLLDATVALAGSWNGSIGHVGISVFISVWENPRLEQTFTPYPAHCWAHNLCLTGDLSSHQTARSSHTEECEQVALKKSK